MVLWGSRSSLMSDPKCISDTAPVERGCECDKTSESIAVEPRRFGVVGGRASDDLVQPRTTFSRSLARGLAAVRRPSPC